MNILPDSRLKTPKNIVRAVLEVAGFAKPVTFNMEQIFCVNCGKPGPWVSTENITSAFHVCDACAPALQPYLQVAGYYCESDAAFFEKMVQAQIEKEGRVLSEQEILVRLEDPNSYLSKLEKDRDHELKRRT